MGLKLSHRVVPPGCQFVKRDTSLMCKCELNIRVVESVRHLCVFRAVLT